MTSVVAPSLTVRHPVRLALPRFELAPLALPQAPDRPVEARIEPADVVEATTAPRPLARDAAPVAAPAPAEAPIGTPAAAPVVAPVRGASAFPRPQVAGVTSSDPAFVRSPQA